MSDNMHITDLSREFIIRQYRMNSENIRTLFKDMSIPDYLALRDIMKYSQIDENGDDRIYLKDLSEKMKLTMPQMSKMAERLNDKGLVTWTHDQNGRSGTYVMITNAGKDLLRNKEEMFRDFFGRVIEKYGRDKMSDLLKEMAELEGVIIEEIGEMPDAGNYLE